MSDRKEPPSDGGYTVGYGKPPLHSRFQKGNQLARKRKAKPAEDLDLSTLADRLLRRKVSIKVDGRRQTMLLGEALIQKLVTDAARGDHRARAQVFKLEELRLRLAGVADPAATAQDQTLDAAEQDIVARYKADLREQVRQEIVAQPLQPADPPTTITTTPGLRPVRIRRRPQ